MIRCFLLKLNLYWYDPYTTFTWQYLGFFNLFYVKSIEKGISLIYLTIDIVSYRKKYNFYFFPQKNEYIYAIIFSFATDCFENTTVSNNNTTTGCESCIDKVKNNSMYNDNICNFYPLLVTILLGFQFFKNSVFFYIQTFKNTFFKSYKKHTYCN